LYIADVQANHGNMMDKQIKIYDLHDSQQDQDEHGYWQNKSPEEKLHTLEVIRRAGNKMGKQNGDKQRLRRVFRIIEPE